MLKKDQAVCIHVVDYSETSQIATLFTRDHGRIRAVAKGSKRPKSALAGPLEVFSHGPVVFSEPRGEGLATLTEFEPDCSFIGLRRELFTLNCGLFAAELLSSFTTDFDPNPELYDSFVGFLGRCQNAAGKRAALKLLLVFQLDLLRHVGSAPVFDACANCRSAYTGNWPTVYFSSEAGGLICRDCESAFAEKVKLSSNVAGCFACRKLLNAADEPILARVEQALVDHFTYLLHRRPKMARYFLLR